MLEGGGRRNGVELWRCERAEGQGSVAGWDVKGLMCAYRRLKREVMGAPNRRDQAVVDGAYLRYRSAVSLSSAAKKIKRRREGGGMARASKSAIWDRDGGGARHRAGSSQA